jgi:capsular polysaccharide transport system ATP-binding protein
MIVLENIHKRYVLDDGTKKSVLKGIDLMIPSQVNVGLIGRNGAGKSTLLRIIGGTDQPSQGTVTRYCRVSWPMGFGGGLQGSLTGRQNTRFVTRIQGFEHLIDEKVAFVEEFADIGDAFDEPVKTYSSGMKSRLQFGLSLAFEFDVYISDEVTSTGDAPFRRKAKQAFEALSGRSSLIMVSHGEDVLRQFCNAGIWILDGKAIWFDRIGQAIREYRQYNRLKENGT